MIAGIRGRTRPGPARGARAGVLEGRRDLVVAVAVTVGLSRLAEGAAVWAAALLLAAAVALGVRAMLAAASAERAVPVAASVTPGVAAFVAVTAIHLVPVGVALLPALLLGAVIVDRTIRSEARILARDEQPTETDRAGVLVEALLVGFLAFVGVAALVPGGLPEPGGASGAEPLSEAGLVVLALADAAVAGALGYRVSALRGASATSLLWSAATYAAAIAIAAAAVRAMDIPRLIGPALLALVFFLWDAFHGAPPARRRDPRWIWQTVILAALGLVVLLWNLGLR